MLDRGQWEHCCDQVDRGRSRRFPHLCGEGTPLKVSHNEDGSFTAWCHRCHEPGFIPAPAESLAQRLERMSAMAGVENQVRRSVDLPYPQVRDVSKWPTKDRVWLFKAGLSTQDIGKLGAYYHPPTDRVVLPIYAGGKLVFWQARATQPGRFPKYLSPDMGPAGKGQVIPRFGKDKAVTLTEDVLSAYKVGLVSEGWSMLGTACSRFLVSQLVDRGCGVNVWLDPDPAGTTSAAKVVKQLRGYGLEVRNIMSPRDPKLMWRSQIKDLLCGNSCT